MLDWTEVWAMWRASQPLELAAVLHKPQLRTTILIHDTTTGWSSIAGGRSGSGEHVTSEVRPCSSCSRPFEEVQLMNMLIQMNGLSCLMIYCCVTCVCMYEGGEGMITSCEVVLLIRRGTTWFTAPGQNVTVSCPVKDCGEPLNIIWCKLLDEKICAQINESKNVEIRQNYDGDKLVSYLSFKEISVHDDGLYRCSTMGYGELTTSHAINISVSDTYEGVENNMKPDDDPAESLSADRDDVVLLWLSNLAISLSVALLVATSMLIIVLRIYGRKLLYILVAEAERADSQGSNSALCVDTKQSEISAEE